MQEKKFDRIIVSRTDSIGDVMLTLPMCGLLKKLFPQCRVFFLGKSYTRAVIQSCHHVDEFLDWDEIKTQSPAKQIDVLKKTNADVFIHVYPRKEILWLAKRAEISMRIATGNRLYTLGKCNRLIFFSRKSSPLHEAQLNLKLLKPLGIEGEFSLEELGEFYGFAPLKGITIPQFEGKLHNRIRILLHPLSKGSAVEWGLPDFQKLVDLLPPDEFEIYITGTAEEGDQMRKDFSLAGNHVHDMTGKFSLLELIVFISQCDALVAASTGPLHIAAALGKVAIGLYSPKRPIHAGRWQPVGKNVHVITASKHPRRGEKLAIDAHDVFNVIQQVFVKEGMKTGM